jgi:hypothetical protein
MYEANFVSFFISVEVSAWRIGEEQGDQWKVVFSGWIITVESAGK